MSEPKVVITVKVEIYDNGWVRWVHQEGEDTLPEQVKHPWTCLRNRYLALKQEAWNWIQHDSNPWMKAVYHVKKEKPSEQVYH